MIKIWKRISVLLIMRNNNIIMNEFQIEYLDHVAIRAMDIDVSAKWYEEVLGLKRYQLPEWGEFPVFLLSGKSGVAIFPASGKAENREKTSRRVKIDHFAFNLTNENFDKAKKRYDHLGIKYDFQDHFYYHSIYTTDPDGHTVELTTIVVDEKNFYKE